MIRLGLALVLLVTLIPADVDRETGTFVANETPRPFCERNPYTCAAGYELADGFILKTKALTKVGLQMLQDSFRPPSEQPWAKPASYDAHDRERTSTLRVEDRELPWQGFANRKTFASRAVDSRRVR